jgi:hypothetical protein
MAGKNWKHGFIPAHERLSVSEQVSAMLAHVDARTAYSKALTNSEKRRVIMDTYPRTPPHLGTLHALAIAFDYWRDVALALKLHIEPRQLAIFDDTEAMA